MRRIKRTNFITRLVTILLFVAMAAYIVVYLINSVSSSIRTAPAVYVEISDSVNVTGMVVREERLISSNEAYISVSAESGQVMAAGETIAVAYSGESALERAGRIRELELQKQYIEAALFDDNSDTTIIKRDNTIRSAVTALGASAARHELKLLSQAAVTLRSLIMDNPDINTTEVDLSLVNEELSRLKLLSEGDTKTIAAPEAGLFFAHADGFEYLSPEDVYGITPEKLSELYESAQDTPKSVLGKLVDPLEWYYAAVIPFEYYEQLKVGGSATLDFGRYCSKPVTASVVSVTYHMDMDFLAVFRCTSSTAEMLYARIAAAEILFGTITGVRVPKEAVYEEQVEVTDELTGAKELVTKHYVFTQTGLQAEKKYINIIWESPDYYLAELSPKDPASLRAGNDIILTDEEIFDGMMLG